MQAKRRKMAKQVATSRGHLGSLFSAFQLLKTGLDARVAQYKKMDKLVGGYSDCISTHPCCLVPWGTRLRAAQELYLPSTRAMHSGTRSYDGLLQVAETVNRRFNYYLNRKVD